MDLTFGSELFEPGAVVPVVAKAPVTVVPSKRISAGFSLPPTVTTTPQEPTKPGKYNSSIHLLVMGFSSLKKLNHSFFKLNSCSVCNRGDVSTDGEFANARQLGGPLHIAQRTIFDAYKIVMNKKIVLHNTAMGKLS